MFDGINYQGPLNIVSEVITLDIALQGVIRQTISASQTHSQTTKTDILNTKTKDQLTNLLQGQGKLRQFCICSFWIQQNLRTAT